MRARRSIVLLAAATFALSCKRDSSQPKPAGTAVVAPNVAPTTVDEPNGPDPFVPSNPDARVTPDDEDLHNKIELPVVESTVIPGQPAPPPDPFEPAIASVRQSAVTCFGTLPPAEYAVAVDFFVTPAGRVSRAEVQPGNVQDPNVLGCVKDLVEHSTFPQTTDGRTLHVEIRVKS